MEHYRDSFCITSYRTHTCGQLREQDAGGRVTLAGWARTVRKMGAVLFIDLADRYGITQIIVEDAQVASDIARESVIRVEGVVRVRSNINTKIPTGSIEVEAHKITCLNTSVVPPFTIKDDTDGGEELRMRYRYLDLRRPSLQSHLLLRHRIARAVRNYLDTAGFVDIETPFLIKSTPEGARDFVVPSRMDTGTFYALPQSPQLFKQLLMLAGYDRYYQIVRCFRDEDLRADRQPEFTQIDCEMSFVRAQDVLRTFEGLTKHVVREIKKIDIKDDFVRMPWCEAMENYGTDKPDLRFDMRIRDITTQVRGHNFPLFDTAETVRAVVVAGAAQYSRKQLDALSARIKMLDKSLPLAYIKHDETTCKSSFDTFFNEAERKKLLAYVGAQAGDLLLITAGAHTSVLRALGTLRVEIAEEMGLRKNDIYKFLWVTDFPLFEWDEEARRFFAAHHPFTAPKAEDAHKLDDPTQLADIKADAYDLVLNGTEIGGGSIRANTHDLQAKILSALGFSQAQAQAQFGFLLEAFKYGAPPHGGIAFGFDRFCALLGGTESIREFIAFPKNNHGRDVMLDAPSPLDESQLSELNLSLRGQKTF